MLAFIIRRLFQGIIVMLAVGLVAFSLFNFVGDPINSLVGIDTPLDEREKLREQLGLNDAFPIQFGRFVVNAVQGDFGLSYRMSEPVMRVIGSRLPATIELSLVAAVIALGLGVGMGVFTGLYPRTAASRAMLLCPQQMSWNWWDDVTVELRLWLPAGSFATSVVRELINTTGDYANIAE